MSFNQSRSDKNDNTAQFNRKLGRSGSNNNNSSYQRSFSGGGRGSGGGGGPSLNPSTGRQSYRKTNNATQGQGGQSRLNVPAPASSESSNSSSALPHNLQNGAHPQPQLQDMPIIGVAPGATDASLTQRSSRADVPKVPSSQSSANNLNAKLPTTPAKGDTSKGGFSLQFGSISPGFMNMQVPARTNSAPPNLDEQKRDQARNDSHRSGSTAPLASIPKPQQPGKVHTTQRSQGAESHSTQKVKSDVPVSLVPPPYSSQKHSAIPLSIPPMQVPFHQPQGPMQFGGPNPQVQSQGLPPTSLHGPMPIPISIGNSSQVPQQVYLPGAHPHPGMMHGQNMGFTAQMGSQMPHQMSSNIGINIPQQFSQQQGGKFSTARKVVKITHPDTHEELRLDKGLPGLRSHPNMPTQSQPVASYPSSHTINYYQSGYSYYPSNPVPLPGSQMNLNSQGSRFNYSVSQGSHGTLFTNPSAPHSLSGSKISPSAGDGPNMGRTRDALPAVSSAAPSTAQVSIKAASDTVADKVVPTFYSDSAAGKSESPKFLQPPEEARSLHLQRDIGDDTEPVLLKPIISGEVSSTASLVDKQSADVGATRAEIVSDAVPLTSVGSSDGFLPDLTTNEGIRKGSLSRTNSMKDQQRKPGEKDYTQSQQVGGSSAFLIPVQSADHSTLVLQEKTALPSVESAEGMSESSCEVLSRRNFGTHEGAESQSDAVKVLNAINGAEDHEFESKDEHSQIEAKSATSKDVKESDEGKSVKVATSSNEIEYSELVGKEHDTVSADSVVSARLTSDSIDAKVSSANAGDKISVSHASVGASDSPNSVDNTEGQEMASKSGLVDSVAPGEVPNVPDELSKYEGTKDISSLSIAKDKLAMESNKAKIAVAPKKKKRKEILQKADAAGTTSDLYMAYKGPEETELILPPESTDSLSTTEVDLKGVDTTSEDLEKESGAQSKFEPDDWEDAADIGTPKLETSENGELAGGSLSSSDRGISTKKYSRDFLLKFAEICNDLPENFIVAPNIAAALMNDHVNTSHYGRESFPSPGRTMDRGSGPRLERRSSNVGDDEKWSRGNPQFGPGRDAQLDLGYGSNVVGFRPGQGGNFGVLRNPRVQSPIHPGGILSGPLQSMGSMQRSNSDADRWQRAPTKGLIPSPQTPSPAIHKAEKKYEVGKVTDEEQAKQRQLKGILNKLTPQNFEKLFQQVKEVNIDSATTLKDVISQIFDKALMEPTFCEMYADFCLHLAGELPDFNEGGEKVTFKRVLLNKCQEEFERGEREEEEANRIEEGEVKQSEEEREEKRIKARRRMLGNIRLIGELYKKKMLTEKIMHECIKKLLGQYQNPDEEDIEALCKLMSTIGEMIDHPKAKGHMDAYFEMMAKLSTNMKVSSRVRFMLQDAIDLRGRKWQQRRKIEGPKKIEEVHRDAAHERQAQTSRLARGPGMSPSVRRGPQMDFGPRGGSSMLPSPNAQMGGFRGYPNQARGFGNQDVRVEERSSYERTLSVPLPQRSLGDDTITLGPQGGLARGMSSIRGTPAMLNVPFMDRPRSSGDSRRTATGLNGYGSGTEGSSFNLNEDNVQRYAPERFINPSVLDQSGGQERSMPSGNRDLRDRGFDRSLATSPPIRVPASTSMQTAPEKVLSEEHLRDMSIAAIKEFYSAKDEKEVALCIRELKSPTFYPSMIALWVTDSFERKDMERNILARLLVHLTSFPEGLLSQADLLRGFESALSSLEDAVNDAPKAPEFLGRIFGKVVLENVIPLGEIGQIIYRGGEEPGRLWETGLAGDVLGSVLEMIQSEKGDSVLNEIRLSSNLRLEDFKPPGEKRSRKLEKFI